MRRSSPATGFRGLVAVAIFAVLAPTFSVASAADPSSATRAVRFADLDISTPAGAHTLYLRILAAAQVVCSYRPFATDGEKARCVREAIADAMTRVNQPVAAARP